MSRPLKPGDRIRLKVKTIGGWKGCGTVVGVKGGLVHFRADGESKSYNPYIACREEVTICRKRNKP